MSKMLKVFSLVFLTITCGFIYSRIYLLIMGNQGFSNSMSKSENTAVLNIRSFADSPLSSASSTSDSIVGMLILLFLFSFLFIGILFLNKRRNKTIDN